MRRTTYIKAHSKMSKSEKRRCVPPATLFGTVPKIVAPTKLPKNKRYSLQKKSTQFQKAEVCCLRGVPNNVATEYNVPLSLRTFFCLFSSQKPHQKKPKTQKTNHWEYFSRAARSVHHCAAD